MTELVWDQIGSRIFEVGVDRGVLYLEDRSGIAWNGLTSVKESSGDNSEEVLYFDGEKYNGDQVIGDFEAALSAYTYPDEFLSYERFASLADGLVVDNQLSNIFHLSYRSLVGNDTENIDFGYKIHILYNLTAVASDVSYQSIQDTITPINFSWDLTSKPEKLAGFKPTAHAILDSRFLRPDILTLVEGILYGTEDDEPYLPTLQELADLLLGYNRFVVVDNGDGTWTATGPDEHFNMIDSTEFELVDVPSVDLDADTYELSSEPLD